MNVLAVFAHPDDEVLGCGGTLAKHAEAEDQVRVYVYCVTRALNGYGAACSILGVHAGHGLYDDQTLDTVTFTRLVHCLDAEKDFSDPDIIYTHHPGDLNTDHALVAKAVLTAFRPKPGEKPRTVLACEVLSSTEWTFPQVFRPNWFEALEYVQLEKKVKAMRCYPSELGEEPHPRTSGGICTQASFRGRQSGVKWAEAFQLMRRGPM